MSVQISPLRYHIESFKHIVNYISCEFEVLAENKKGKQYTHARVGES